MAWAWKPNSRRLTSRPSTSIYVKYLQMLHHFHDCRVYLPVKGFVPYRIINHKIVKRNSTSQI